MELNTTSLRGILARILSVDENHVVPKQGNWWNPQQPGSNVDNWCAYRIKSNRPRIVPFYHEGNDAGTPVNGAAVLKIAEIELQFVGPQSEDLAQNVALWGLRSDVKEAFAEVRGSVLYDDTAAFSSTFYQDGNNTVTAWNTNFNVLWYSILDTSQGVMPGIEFNGTIRAEQL